mgnify:FL=1
MNKEIYKIIRFDQVAIGQEFEEAAYYQIVTREPWTKSTRNIAATLGGERRNFRTSNTCLVRIADCTPRHST